MTKNEKARTHHPQLHHHPENHPVDGKSEVFRPCLGEIGGDAVQSAIVIGRDRGIAYDSVIHEHSPKQILGRSRGVIQPVQPIDAASDCVCEVGISKSERSGIAGITAIARQTRAETIVGCETRISLSFGAVPE